MISWFITVSAITDQTEVSDVILLPGSQVVNIKLPDSDHYVEIHSIRSLPEGSEISADHAGPVNILCPGVRLVQAAPGETVACPQPQKPDIQLLAVNLADLLLPPPPLPPDRGPEDLFQVSKEAQQARLVKQEFIAQHFQEIEHQVQSLSVSDEERRILQAWLYESAGSYTKAIDCLKTDPPSENPAILRFLGTLSLKLGKDEYRTAARYFSQAAERSQTTQDLDGEANARHYLATIAAALGHRDMVQKEAETALELYRTLGYTQQIESVKQLLANL